MISRQEAWALMPFPILSYNSDLGIQLGAFADLLYYGKEPSLYPRYHHKFHFEGSHYTAGQTLIQADYDSPSLIPGVRITATAQYQLDPLLGFYGFSGDPLPYDASLNRNGTNAFYSYSRTMWKASVHLLGDIRGQLKWIAGLSFWKFRSGDLEFGNYDASNTIFRQYRDASIIRDEELDLSVTELRAGLMWDSRDHEQTPTKGSWSELYLTGSPGLGGGGAYLKLVTRFRFYYTPGPDYLTLAGHIGTQTSLCGQQPFNMMSSIYQIFPKQTYSEGLGGLNTVRGVLGARLLGRGYLWANLETRIRILKFKLWGFDLWGAVNPFYDLGLVTQAARLEGIAALRGRKADELKGAATKLHRSLGLGLKAGINSMILSIEAAGPLNPDDGTFGISFTTFYIF